MTLISPLAAATAPVPPQVFNQVVGQFELIIILLVVTAFAIFAFFGMYIFGMGPFRGLVFYKGPLLMDVNPDNSLTFRKMHRLRKAMMVYHKKGNDYPVRAGLLSGYITNNGPRLYIRYSPSEMAVQVRLLPWIKRISERMKKEWKYTPQTWEQLCLVFYKDFIDKKMNDPTATLSSTERTILMNDKALIEEIETGSLRPYLSGSGQQLVDMEKKPLWHPPHTLDEREQLLDRCENAMVSENPEDLKTDTVDIKDAVMFRRSTFTDNDLSDAYNEGYAKAKEGSGRDSTKIFVMGMTMFWVFIGAAVLLQTIHVI